DEDLAGGEVRPFVADLSHVDRRVGARVFLFHRAAHVRGGVHARALRVVADGVQYVRGGDRTRRDRGRAGDGVFRRPYGRERPGVRAHVGRRGRVFSRGRGAGSGHAG